MKLCTLCLLIIGSQLKRLGETLQGFFVAFLAAKHQAEIQISFVLNLAFRALRSFAVTLFGARKISFLGQQGSQKNMSSRMFGTEFGGFAEPFLSIFIIAPLYIWPS